jgi:hypothetical protein
MSSSMQQQQQQQDHECVFSIDRFSKELNKFLDLCIPFKAEFGDNPPEKTIAERIVKALTTRLDMSWENEHHPFKKYADSCDFSAHEVCGKLRDELMSDIQDTPTRSYIPAFFCSGGVNYDFVCEFLEEFFEFHDNSFEEDSEQDQIIEHAIASAINTAHYLEGDEDDDSDSDYEEYAPIPPMPSFLPQLIHT